MNRGLSEVKLVKLLFAKVMCRIDKIWDLQAAPCPSGALGRANWRKHEPHAVVTSNWTKCSDLTSSLAISEGHLYGRLTSTRYAYGHWNVVKESQHNRQHSMVRHDLETRPAGNQHLRLAKCWVTREAVYKVARYQSKMK